MSTIQLLDAILSNRQSWPECDGMSEAEITKWVMTSAKPASYKVRKAIRFDRVLLVAFVAVIVYCLIYSPVATSTMAACAGCH